VGFPKQECNESALESLTGQSAFDQPSSLRTCSLAPSALRWRAEPNNPMPQNYVPIFISIVIIATLLPVTLLLAKLVRPDNPSKTKLMPYECGIDPVDNARGRYTVRYYIIAILFVVFDVETIFLFPWAVKFKAFGLFGLIEMLIFLAILIVGYIWVWNKGALEWV
jgi:NADH-quinone oxidoreductase subunit A